MVASSGRGFNGVADVSASNEAQLDVVFDPASRSPDAIVDRVKRWQYLVPDAHIVGAGRGMGGAAPIAYSISGENGAADGAAALVAAALRSDPLATDVQTSNAGIGPRMDLSVQESRAELFGVPMDDAAQTARIGSGGAVAARVRKPDGLEDVLVRSEPTAGGGISALQQSPVRNAAGTLVPLGALDRVALTMQPTVIERENGGRVVTVTANPLGSAPIGSITGPIARALANPSFLPPGAAIQPRGDIEQFLDAVSKLFTALLFSLAAIYVVLAVLYRSYVLPLVIMATVPLACVGAFGILFVLNLAHALFPGTPLFANETLNFYSMLGIVMLVGLVAKNGILLVEFAEREVRDGSDRASAMKRAAERRLRPILMTTLAMIAGMLPLALGSTAGAEYRKALGSVVIGGLSSSPPLTLFVVPIVYVWGSKQRVDLRVREPLGDHSRSCRRS